MSHNPRESLRRASRLVKRHLYLVILLCALALFASQSMSVYLMSDDFRWVHRTVDDAGAPLSAFGMDLIWGDYYRPVPSLVWMLNYYLWGVNFTGYQLALVGVWLASVGFVYGIGCRLGGRLAGAFAATLLGFNRTFLAMVSWKSWFSSLLELMFLSAAVWLFLMARDTKRKGLYWAAGALAVAAALSKELAPLVAGVVAYATLVEPHDRVRGWTRRRAAGLTLWAAVVLAAILAIPSYRSAAATLAGQVAAPSQPTEAELARAASAEMPSFSHAYVYRNLHAHLHYLYAWGVPACGLAFLLVAEFGRTRNFERTLGPRRHYLVLGAFAALIALLPLVYVAWSGVLHLTGAEATWPEARRTAATGLVERAGLTLLFAFIATRGDRRQRMLGLWFLVSFPPILFLAHRSAAYLLIPFVGMALFFSQVASRETLLETLPAGIAAWKREGRGREWAGRAGRALAAAAVLLATAWMLAHNMLAASEIVRGRAESGVEDRQLTEQTVRLASEAFKGDKVFAAAGLSEIAGLLLRERHGFEVRFPGYPEPDRRLLALFRDPRIPLNVYRAVPLDNVMDANLVPQAREDLPGAPEGYKSPSAPLLTPPPGESRARIAYVERPEAGAMAFGAVILRNPWIREAKLVARVVGEGSARQVSAHAREVEGGWEQLLGSVTVGPNVEKLEIYLETRVAQPPEGAPYTPELRIDALYCIPDSAVRSQGRTPQ